MSFTTTTRAGFRSLFFIPGDHGNLRGQYPRRHGDDTVADKHHDRCDKLSHGCSRRNISIANRCDGDDGPVNTFGYAFKSILSILHQVHDGTEYDHDAENGHHEYAYFLKRTGKGYPKKLHLCKKVDKLEYPEYAE